MDLNKLNDIIEDGNELWLQCTFREGFAFTNVTFPANVYDSIIINLSNNPKNFFIKQWKSDKTFEEHIEFINKHKLEKACIIADDINFIKECPSLKYLSIIPSDEAPDKFDYSPLYKMPKIKYVSARTKYGINEEYSTTIDCSKINGLERIGIDGDGWLRYNEIVSLKSLFLSGYKFDNLADAFSSRILDTLTLIQCKIKSLDGIEQTDNLICLYLYYNRSLKDISKLAKFKKTLKALRIQNCPKITDFSVLRELEGLELLELTGKNELPNLDFISGMKSLKTFVFNMNIADGDLTPCKSLTYVNCSRVHKHYNLKNNEFPKGNYFRGNDKIELWRRLE